MIMIYPSLLFLLLAALVISIIISLCFYELHCKDGQEYKKIEEKIKKKYILPDVILHNAVLEAYEAAIDKDDKFEINAYGKLLRDIQGRW